MHGVKRAKHRAFSAMICIRMQHKIYNYSLHYYGHIYMVSLFGRNQYGDYTCVIVCKFEVQSVAMFVCC